MCLYPPWHGVWVQNSLESEGLRSLTIFRELRFTVRWLLIMSYVLRLVLKVKVNWCNQITFHDVGQETFKLLVFPDWLVYDQNFYGGRGGGWGRGIAAKVG